ncbi:MAG: lipid A deacylase LpxR family protein [Pseudomonadales bacterium]|nr:lipid A deacylase LpxR family protein [Pseudomonadales bacterium]
MKKAWIFNRLVQYSFLMLLFLCSQPVTVLSEPQDAPCPKTCNTPAENKAESHDAISFSLYMDNDTFAGSRDDGDYTGGLALAFSGKNAAQSWFCIRALLSLLDFSLNFAGSATKQSQGHGCELGLALFTPSDIKVSTPIVDDRPYASLLYLSNTQQVLSADASYSWLASLSIGILGLDAAGNFQNAIHKAIDANEAKGWEHQISAGGEPTMQYSLTLQQYHHTAISYLQISTAAGINIGYISDAVIGINMRMGNIQSAPYNFNVYTNSYGNKSKLSLLKNHVFNEFYFLAGANIKARAYNVFLQGQFKSSTIRYSHDEVEPIILEIWAGTGLEFNTGIEVSYIIRYQSSEVKVGLANRKLFYGELMIGYHF